jgi:hypothetical protein
MQKFVHSSEKQVNVLGLWKEMDYSQTYLMHEMDSILLR